MCDGFRSMNLQFYNIVMVQANHAQMLIASPFLTNGLYVAVAQHHVCTCVTFMCDVRGKL